MAKFTCPYCYKEHSLTDCVMKCVQGQNATCPKRVAKDAQGFIPKNRMSGCMGCRDASKQLFCPVIYRSNQTLKLIPRDCLDGPSLPIALLGAKASGKSNYIGVLVNEIRRKMSSRFNCMLSVTSSEESKLYYDKFYYDPLFNKNNIVDATNAGEEIPPLIFPLRFFDNKNRINKSAVLTFYDTAGENLDSKGDMDIYNQYIPNSQGIILLLDPLQVSSIRKQLEGKMALPNKNTEINIVLQRVVDIIRDVKNLKGNIKIPLAVVFTKIDALEKFDVLPENSCLRDESEHLKRGVFVNSDYENCNEEMQTLVANWLDGELLTLIKCFDKCSFFGVSSFGNIPNGSKLSSEIKPRRVLDPLLWLLAENNYIKKVK